MPNRYEIEIETRFRELWPKASERTVDSFVSLVIDAANSLEPGFDQQRYEAAGVFALRHLFLFVPTHSDVKASEQSALDRLKEALL